jgi:hypothetical protein
MASYPIQFSFLIECYYNGKLYILVVEREEEREREKSLRINRQYYKDLKIEE